MEMRRIELLSNVSARFRVSGGLYSGDYHSCHDAPVNCDHGDSDFVRDGCHKPSTRLELVTFPLPRGCSTSEPRGRRLRIVECVISHHAEYHCFHVFNEVLFFIRTSRSTRPHFFGKAKKTVKALDILMIHDNFAMPFVFKIIHCAQPTYPAGNACWTSKLLIERCTHTVCKCRYPVQDSLGIGSVALLARLSEPG